MTPSERAAIAAISWIYFDQRTLREGNRVEVEQVAPRGGKRLFRIERRGLFISYQAGEIELHDVEKDFKIFNERPIKEGDVKIEHTERYNKIFFTEMASTRIKGHDEDGRFEIRPDKYEWVKLEDESYGTKFLYHIKISL